MKVRAFAGFAGLGVVIAAAIAALVWGLAPSGGAGAHTSTGRTVVYEVEADAAHGAGRSGSYTTRTDTGGTSQGTGLLPMTGTYQGFHRGDFVYVSVQNANPAGSVTCRITVDGTVVSENTSSGGYTIATCQATVR